MDLHHDLAHVCVGILQHDFTANHPNVSWHREAQGRTQTDQTFPLFLVWLCGGTVRGTVCLCPTAMSCILDPAPTIKKLSHPVGNCSMVSVHGAGWSLPVTFEHWLRESSHCLHLLTICFTAGDEPMECFPGKPLLFSMNAFIHSGVEGAKFPSTLGSLGTCTKKRFLKVWFTSL